MCVKEHIYAKPSLCAQLRRSGTKKEYRMPPRASITFSSSYVLQALLMDKYILQAMLMTAFTRWNLCADDVHKMAVVSG